MLTSPQKPTRSPPINRNKPLPSPPIAQYVNPLSPPKAQRTLVDAQVTGTPTSEDWPILPPENVPSKNSSPPSGSCSVYSEDVAQRLGVEMSSNKSGRSATAPLNAGSRRVLSPAPDSSTNRASPLLSVNAFEPTPVVLHAITTAYGEALESPLAHKLVVPPRTSSKRTSLPLPNRKDQQSVITAAITATSRRQQTRSGCTNWPMLGAKGNQDAPFASTPLIPNQDSGNTVENNGPDTVDSDAHSGLEPADICRLTLTQEVPQETRSSLVTEMYKRTGPSNRVKRLSGHSTSPGFGPTLTIADDANSVLLGQKEPMPAWPIVLDAGPHKATEERSLSALAGRISRQTMSRISMSIGSRSSTPQPSENDSKMKSTVKIYPTRSMQPPREASIESPPRSSSLPLPRLSQLVSKGTKLPLTSSGGKRHSSAPFQITTRREHNSTDCGIPRPRGPTVDLNKTDQVSGWTQACVVYQVLTLLTEQPHCRSVDIKIHPHKGRPYARPRHKWRRPSPTEAGSHPVELSKGQPIQGEKPNNKRR